MSEPQFPLTVMMLTGGFLNPGNRVDVTLNGDGTYPWLWQDVRSAQHSITLQLYYGLTDGWPRCLATSCVSGPPRARVFVLYAFGTAHMVSMIRPNRAVCSSRYVSQNPHD